MNTNNIKQYAPKAREAFRKAIEEQLKQLGISDQRIETAEIIGDQIKMGINLKPKSIANARARLVAKVSSDGEQVDPIRYDQLVEQAAYTWFNRFCALRYMELHGYLSTRYRLLSHPDPQSALVAEVLAPNHILEVAEALGMENSTEIQMLLLEGKTEEVYRQLILAECQRLHRIMPFLFDAIQEELALLLPNNLTGTGSILEEFTTAIPEEDWQNIEIIGWLYQYYIADKKAEVDKDKVAIKKEDIPFATQLFTPNWIVQYLVQNSLGQYWMQSYPQSALKEKMPYYITPAEQSEAVIAQLSHYVPTYINPEEIKIMEPACGSGHILVEAYNILKEIYRENGYLEKQIPRLILEKNLYGLDIDDRAVQLASFALLMIAIKDDISLLTKPVHLNLMAFQESADLDADELMMLLQFPQENAKEILVELITDFADAKNAGSLIKVKQEYHHAIGEMLSYALQCSSSNDSLIVERSNKLVPILQQAYYLSQQYDAVITNPPYLSTKGMNADLKAFATKEYPQSKSDLFATFLEVGFYLLADYGYNAQVDMQSWMFLSSYETLREKIVTEQTIQSLIHLGSRAFPQISGEVVQTVAWVMLPQHIANYTGSYIRVIDFDNAEEKDHKTLEAIQNRQCGWFYESQPDNFKKIPGSPIAYWLSEKLCDVFQNNPPLSDFAQTRKGLVTGCNKNYVRNWFEVSISNTSLNIALDRDESKHSTKKWFSYINGGGFSKWYGLKYSVINWENDGWLLRNTKHPKEKRIWATNFNLEYIFKPNINWGGISSKAFSARISIGGELFDAGGSACFCYENKENNRYEILGLLNSKLSNIFLESLNPTLNFQAGNIADIPLLSECPKAIKSNVKSLINLSKQDWDAYETSWDFTQLPLIALDSSTALAERYATLRENEKARIAEVQRLETENNRLFIEAYGLEDELSPEVPLEEITLTCNPAYRYGGAMSEEEKEKRYQSDTIVEFLSYIIGCSMGRYSLDRPGLVYAQAGNEGFQELVDAGAYAIFPADKDGFMPLTGRSEGWFSNDATSRVREFVRTLWGEADLEANLRFIANSLLQYALKPKKGEMPLETIERYFNDQFYKDHCRTYQKTPIYWLVSSGKAKAFECLIYLHRYNSISFSKLRMDYVVPLIGRMRDRIGSLQESLQHAEATAEKNRLNAKIKTLEKQYAELVQFDEELRSIADQQISLDLDDGVKVNYEKLRPVLAKI